MRKRKERINSKFKQLSATDQEKAVLKHVKYIERRLAKENSETVTISYKNLLDKSLKDCIILNLKESYKVQNFEDVDNLNNKTKLLITKINEPIF
jgi:hypothetical protein